MSQLRFDLNDIENEPSDEELAALMEAVAEEARRRHLLARTQMLDLLRQALKEARLRESLTVHPNCV